MATKTWIGAVNNSWTNIGNWFPSLPATGDDVIFNGVAPGGNNNCTYNVGVALSLLSINFTGYTGQFTFSNGLNITGSMNLGSGLLGTFVTSATPTTYTVVFNAAASGFTANGKILPTNISLNLNGGVILTITGNAECQGNFSTTSNSHTIKAAATTSVNLRVGGNISLLGTTTSTVDPVIIKGYGVSKTFSANTGCLNQKIVFESGSVYTNTAANVGSGGTSSYTVEAGGRFNAINNIASSSISGTLTLSGFNGLSDFMSISSSGAFILSNDTVIKGFFNIISGCTVSTSTGAKILLQGNLTSSNSSVVTIDNLEFSGTTLSTVSAATSGGNLQIKALSFNKTGAGSVNFTSLFGLAIPTAIAYTWTHTSGTITQSLTSRINIVSATTTSQLIYSESGSLTTPFTFSQLSINGGILSLNSKLRATRLYLTLGLSLTNITSSGLFGFDVDMLYFINVLSAVRTITLKSGCTYNMNVDFISYSQFATLGQITLNASTVGGTKAFFNLDNNASQSVEYVSATDIDSSGTLGVAPFTKQLIWSFNGVIAGTTINWSTGSQPPPVLPSRTAAYTFVN
jgi:hypothetical protein